MRLLLAIFIVILSRHAMATKDVHPSVLRVKAGDKQLFFSAYVDGYYAYDFSNPYNGSYDLDQKDGGRQFTSNPLYDRQFSFGYGFLQTEFEHKGVGFRLAYQFGDIVQKMYEGEPERLRQLREASANVQLTDKLHMEIGYMPSIFGFETFINKENMHATRSYMNDFAPDFDAGARFYYKTMNSETLKFQITNGWQVLRDNNNKLALGGAYVKEIPKKYLFNWGVFIGDEAPRHKKTSYRFYNNIFMKFMVGERWIIAPVLDIGWEQQTKTGKQNKTWAPWQSYGLSVRYALTEKHGIATRYDRTRDIRTIIPELNVSTPNGWSSNGYTLTYEYLYNENCTMRVEGRYVKSRDAVFERSQKGKYSDEDSFLMSQIALSF
jgi:hypothetical protein